MYLFTFRERGREGEGKWVKCWCVRETLISCLLHGPNQGPGPHTRHVPQLGIEPVTFWFAGWCSIHWATPARAQQPFILKIRRQVVWNLFFPIICMDLSFSLKIFIYGFERERKPTQDLKKILIFREERKHWFVVPLMHSLVDSYVCPDCGLNPQPWPIGMTLWPIKLPSQGTILSFNV